MPNFVHVLATGSSRMYSHFVGLLKQLIYYVMMKLKSVSADHTEVTVMQCTYRRAK